MTNWHERDDFWETFAPFLFPEERWEITKEEVDQMLLLLDLESGATILDLCCGQGRHSLELTHKGYRVTGVDRTSTYLHQARQRAKQEGIKVEFVEGDMRQFSRPEAFDAALLMFTSFGYFEAHEDNLKVLQNVKKSLRDGGKILVEVMGKEILARIFLSRSWEERDGVFWLQDRKISHDWSKIENRWILIGKGKEYKIQFSHWIYSAAELSNMLREASFGDVICYGDLSGKEYDNQARRLVCVGTK